LIEIGSKTAEKNSAQTNRQTDRHYENNGHLAVNQYGTRSSTHPSTPLVAHWQLLFTKHVEKTEHTMFDRALGVSMKVLTGCGELRLSGAIVGRRSDWTGHRHRWPSSGGQTTSVFHQATKANSASCPMRDEKWVPAEMQWRSAAGE